MNVRRVFAIAILLVACKGKADKSSEEAAKPGKGVEPVKVDGGAAKQTPKEAPPKKPALTKEQRKAYRKHLSTGRKLGGAKKWGDAIPEFQAALEVIPDDPRASAELGWAAFQAGDYVTAKKANSLAARAAGDRKVKASALYNLGRVAEATGDTKAATKLYQDSLALRPNQTVEARLAGLGTPLVSHDAPVEPPPCHDPLAAAEDVCACLAKQPSDWADPDAQPSCELESGVESPDDVAVARVDIDWGNAEYYLLTKGPKGWVATADLGYLYKGGMAGVSGEWEIAPITEETIAGHRILRVTVVENHTDNDMGIDETESQVTTTLTVCVLGDAPVCPLSVPTSVVYDRERLFMAEDDEIDDEAQRLMTPGLPIHDELKIDVDIGADGTANVVLKKGAANDMAKSLLGPHKLF